MNITGRRRGTADKRVRRRPIRSTDHAHMQGTSCSGSTRSPATERPRRLYPDTGTVPACVQYHLDSYCTAVPLQSSQRRDLTHFQIFV